MLESLIKEEINLFHRGQYIKRLSEHFLMEELLSGSGGGSSQVLQMIKDDIWEDEDVPKKFYDSYMKSRYKEMLTPYTVSELSEFDLYKVKGEDIGFAIKNNGEIIAVHNNSNIKGGGIGKELIKAAIRNGGRHLDHFDGFLTGFYSDLGFKETSRLAWDDQYAPNNWKYEPIDIFDPKKSVYAKEIADYIKSNNIKDPKRLPDKYKQAIKRYRQGKPDVIFREL